LEKIDRLFVYGSLMRGEARARLVATAKSIERATAVGHLYALAEGYPALIASDGGGIVVGELLTFDAIGSLLVQLDDYEGFDPKRPDASLFLRVSLEAHPIWGPPVLAYAYVMPRAKEPQLIAAGAVRVADGRWSSKAYALGKGR
jgi:gamma-glutamylcyclotransferase (GGCT)/AIG2-like uncharacterized protein YtfP